VIDGQPVRSNQLLYKAILLNTLILMQDSQNPAAMQRVEMQLKETF
jgi:hypothetical protein